MKKIYSLMIACVFAGQVFAAGSDEDVTTEIQQQAIQVVEKLKQDGLSSEQILETVQAALKESDDSTQGAYRSILSDKKFQERIVWILIGAVAVLGIEYVAWPYAAKPLFSKIRGTGSAKATESATGTTTETVKTTESGPTPEPDAVKTTESVATVQDTK